MKPTSNLFIFLLTLLPLAASAYAQSPREQLNQMVEQLQKAPTDNALRERIIALATSIKPVPAIPEAGERHMARGSAGVRTAAKPADFKEAAAEFDQAALAAPWYGDAYYNAGIAYSKAGDHATAINKFNLYLITAPSAADQKDAKAKIFEEEFLLEKAAKSDESARTKRKTLIAPGVGIGEVQIGILDSQVIAALGAPVTRERVFGGGGAEYLHYDRLRIQLSPDRRVSDAESYHRDFATSEGLGFGSAKSEVLSAMGTPSHKEAVEGREVWYYRQRGITFGFTDPQSPSKVNYVGVSKPW